MDMFPEITNDANLATNEAILSSLRRAGEILKSSQRSDYWMTDEGQARLLRKIAGRGRHPPTGLNVFDYTEASETLLYSAGNAGQEEWIEIELRADTGARDTVMLRKLCAGIPIQTSLQSLVHKPLFILSRCADMGFESRFGLEAGALIDEVTSEVISLECKGSLYVLKCWLKAAPFGRPEGR